MKIGVMYGNPETTSGGLAEVLASVRLDVRRIGAIKEHEPWSATRPASRWSRTSWLRRSDGPVRHHVRRGRVEDRRVGRPRRQGRRGRKVRRLVLLRQRPHRARPRERQDLPQGKPRHRPFLCRRGGHAGVAVELARRKEQLKSAAGDARGSRSKTSRSPHTKNPKSSWPWTRP